VRRGVRIACKVIVCGGNVCMEGTVYWGTVFMEGTVCIEGTVCG
jgi:hypothetical protein